MDWAPTGAARSVAEGVPIAATTVERRLAAILAADVVGYSRLMGEDEAGTLAALKAHRRTLFDPKIAEHRGRIVKTTGDGVLAEFPSVVEAVRCAVETQRGLSAANESVRDDRRLRLRIGINLGDIIFDENDIYGDGVNVAARLEQLAEPGGICVSRGARDPVIGKLPLTFEDLGEQQVKNIAKPVRVFRVRYKDDDWPLAATPIGAAAPKAKRSVAAVGAGLAVMLIAAAGAMWWLQGFVRQAPTPVAPPQSAGVAPPAPAVVASRSAPPSPSDRMSLVVLPFNNLSDDPRQEYFSDGMTEDLTTDLSKVPGLFVIARNSAFVYKSRAVNVTEVGRELGVRYVIEGSIRKAGERVRITAQLIDASSGLHVWAERYDRDLKDIFDLQDDVRQKIVAALAITLNAGDRQRLAQRPTNNLAAYDLWARGTEQMNTFTPSGIREARRLFEQAVAMDPGFARAWSQLANTYALEADLGIGAISKEQVEAAIGMAQRAISLDASLPQARWALARTYFWYGDTKNALAELEKAVALDPNFADGYAYYGLLLVWTGRAEESLPAIERAMRINPHFPFWYVHALGYAQFMLTHYDAAAQSFRKALERNPAWQPSRRMLVATYGYLGKLDDANWEVAELHAAGDTVTLADYRRTELIRDPIYLERLLEGLRRAGVPE
ncbi:MAG: hypothetical protein HY246_03090 [Proteobacteria bacterium]|nr:hypothetical protein [Pseudomonadota bacterium]